MKHLTPHSLSSLFSNVFPLSAINCDSQPFVEGEKKETTFSCRIVVEMDGHEETHRASVTWGGGNRLPDVDLPMPVMAVWEKITWGGGKFDTWQVQDGFGAETPSDILGWVSWLRAQIQGEDKQARRPMTYYPMPNTCRLCWNWAGRSTIRDIWNPESPLQSVQLGEIQYNVPNSSLKCKVVFPRPNFPDAAIINRKGKGVEVLGVLKALINDIEDLAVEILRAFGDDPVTASPKGWSGPPVSLSIIEDIKKAVDDAQMKGKSVSHIFVDPQSYDEILNFLAGWAIMENYAVSGEQVLLHGIALCLEKTIEPGRFELNARYPVQTQHR